MHNNDVIAQAYSTAQTGGDLPYFVGSQYGGGGGWLRSIARIAFPILKKLVGVAANTASDMIYEDQKFLPAVSKNVLGALAPRSSPTKAAAAPKNRGKKRRKQSGRGTILT